MDMAVSIGIPFYNAEPFLADAVKSILAQTHSDWELILVDDGSTDRSLEIARSFADPRIRVISDGQNRRLPFRLNQITALARYDIVARMDADDLAAPARIEKQLAILAAEPRVDLVSTGVCSITNDNVPIGIRYGDSGVKISGPGLIRGECSIVHASVIGRKSWFMRNPYDETAQLTEDFELWLRASSQDDLQIRVLREPLYYYREEGNVVANKLVKAYNGQIAIIKRYAPAWFGRLELAFIVNKFRAKIVIVKLLNLANLLKILLAKRNVPIESTQQLDYLSADIRKILNIGV